MTQAQQELLEAMKRGCVCHYMRGIDSYCFRTDTMRRCTRQAEALLKAGLVEKHKEDWRGYQLRIKKYDPQV